jgi:hypothetical protein
LEVRRESILNLRGGGEGGKGVSDDLKDIPAHGNTSPIRGTRLSGFSGRLIRVICV